MPEPISSIPSAKILENYRTLSSLRTEALPATQVAKISASITDTLHVSQEAREKLKEARQAKQEDTLYQEQTRRQRDEELRRSLEVLELGTEASREAIRKAYRLLMQNYHPDKYAHLPPEFRKLADLKARQIIEAYVKLTE